MAVSGSPVVRASRSRSVSRRPYAVSGSCHELLDPALPRRAGRRHPGRRQSADFCSPQRRRGALSCSPRASGEHRAALSTASGTGAGPAHNGLTGVWIGGAARPHHVRVAPGNRSASERPQLVSTLCPVSRPDHPTGQKSIMWKVFRREGGREESQDYEDLDRILTSFCPDLWKEEIRVEGPNGERYSMEDIRKLCTSRGLTPRRWEQ